MGKTEHSKEKSQNFQQKVIEVLKNHKCLQLFLLLFPVGVFVFQILNTEFLWFPEQSHSVIISIIGASIIVGVIYGALYLINDQQSDIIERLTTIERNTDNLLLRNYDSYDGVSLLINNMYDFLIHAPVYLGFQYNYYRKEFLNVETHSTGSDIDAIRGILHGEGIAITDPYYINELDENKKNDLIILSPLIIEPAIWSLEKNTDDSENKKYFVYDDKSSSYFLGLKYINDDEENFKKNLITLSNLYQKTPLTYQEFLQSIFNNKYGIADKLKEFSHLFLTEPDISYIKSEILTTDEYHKKDIKEDNNKYIFTALITTKTFIRNNPVVVLKFLKSLKYSLLKIQDTYTDIYSIVDQTMLNDNASISSKIRTNINPKTLKELYPKDLYIFYKKNRIIERIEWLESTFKYYKNKERSFTYKSYILDMDSGLVDEKLKASFNYILTRLQYND